jgi:hypothetical protein
MGGASTHGGDYDGELIFVISDLENSNFRRRNRRYSVGESLSMAARRDNNAHDSDKATARGRR